ncbi:uncharacterized protein [Pagrus major]|uniref:uncharacterized protein isoform X3 n=1 Tax=Pagrus major TaxID=143350 RepID=UPI003CC83BC3
MTHVHYKFSSKLSYDTVVFDGPHITLKDLKRQIMGREKLRAGDCDLQITNAQTKEEYTDEEGLIPKGSSVIVRRIPNSGGRSGSNSKTRNTERSDVQHHHAFGALKAMEDQSSSRALPLFSKMANLADADVPEEDKIKVVLNQSIYESMNYNKKFGAVLPANYTCYRCGTTGHHIRNCPATGVRPEHDKNFEAPPRLKKSTGIPRSFMVEVDDPSIKGAMLTNSGHYAIPAIHAKAYAIGKKEKPPFVLQEKPEPEDEEDPVPNELLCLICHDLLSDAVVIPCCGNSYCDDCIRTALLDSENHVCSTCGQSDVSPDTLIPNKFLRQAVNTFKKEQGHSKSLRGRCGSSQSQNPTPTPSPVPTPPPPTMQIQPQKPYQSSHSQQDPLLYCAQTADTPSSSQVCGAPTTATGPTPAPDTPSTFLQPAQSHLEVSDREPEERTHDDSAAAAPSVLVSHEDPDAAASQLIPLVNPTAEEQPQTVNPQQSSSGPAQRNPGPSTCWESSSSSSCPPAAWSELNNRQLPPSSSSSSYPVAPPPLFPSPHFHTFLATQQPLNRYPPGYPPATPVWTLPTPQGAPIPSLCSSASSPSIPTLIPQNWYMHQRKKKERSPNRGSAYRRSSSRSKSSMSKSSHSYSRSSSKSRSRSRSRSQGRSRPHSPYSRHRNLHTRSHSSHSYSYGYKRSPTPSSSSSPRVGYRSRSKSPSDHHKTSHHSRHHSKKSTSSRYSSRKRGEHPQKETGGEGRRNLPAQPANQTSSLELDRERYLQWKRAYKEWCEKYFNSYVGHFHQLPPPLLGLPPSPPPQWVEREGSKSHSRVNSEPRNRLQGRRTDGRSPPSQSSSDSRSPPSQSSSDSRSTPSQSSSDSRSSPSHSSRDSRSPPSQSSTDGRSTPSEEGAHPRTLTKGSKEVDLQERNKDKKQLSTKKSENFSTLKHEQKSVKKHEKERGEVSSSPDSTDDCRKDKKSHNSGPSACKDGTPVQDKVTASEALESVQTLVKPSKHLDKERKNREQRSSEIDKGLRREKYSDSRQDVERRHKERRSKGAGRLDTDRYRNPGGSRASDSRSDKNRKRKGEDVQRSSVKAQSSKCLKTKIAEVPETRKSESLNPIDEKKQKTEEKKKERKTLPLTEQDIWEGGIKVKPQKKISININLDVKRKEENTEKLDLFSFESIIAKSSEEIEKTGIGERLNSGATEIEVNEKKESTRNLEGEPEGEIKPEEREAKPVWKKDTHRDDEREMEKKEHIEEENFDLWLCAIRGAEEEKKESKKPWEERDRMEASEGQQPLNDERRSVREGHEKERRVRSDGGGQEMEESVAGPQKERAEGESTCKDNRGNLPKEEPMEGVKWLLGKEEEEGTTRSKSQRSRNESHHDRSNTKVDDGSSYEDHQEMERVMKTLEEFTQDRAADREEDPVSIQVPRSKWDKEESEEEKQDEPELKVQKEALAVFLPPSSSSVSVTAETPSDRKTEGENEQRRHREIERGRDRAMDRGKGREGERNSRSVAPSSGKDRPDNTLSTERDGERRVEMERPKDRERGRESERPRDRQKESKRSKERTRDEEKGRDRERERGHGSRNLPSSSHDKERRDRQRGDDQGGDKSSWGPGGKFSSSSISRAGELPDQNAHKTCRDTFFDLSWKARYHSQNPRDTPGNYRRQDRPTGTHHSPPTLSHSWGKELPSESSGGSELRKPRMSSTGRELTQSRYRNESKVEKGEYKRNKVDKVIKEGKVEGDADKLYGGRELEEGERPSSNSVSSSASQESSDDNDDGKKEWKKKHKKEKRRAAPELLEEGELQKHKHKKKAKKSRDGGEEGSGGEVDDKWKEEEERAKLCSVMLF